MKKLFLLVFLLTATAQIQLASAQAAELQQLVLDIEKLAQLKKILGDMKTGFDIVSKGYGTIKNLSEGNYNIHEAFLDGLLVVNPKLRKYQRVADIIHYQEELLKEYKAAFREFKSSGKLKNVRKNGGIVGRRVVVHLTTNPVLRQGETGKVVEVSTANPYVLVVEFNDGNRSAYMANGLLTMRSKKDVLKSLFKNSMNIDKDACKIMIRICRLLSERRQGDALELAASDSTTQALCTLNCETWMGLKAKHGKNITRVKRLK